MGATWLVTGAAGFIGSNLCRYLLDSGQTVIGLDNFATGKRENVARVRERADGRFRFVEGDIRDKPIMAEVFQQVSTVVHLAAQGSVQKSYADIHYNNDVNITGFLNALTTAAEAGARTFIYASSCAVYGDNQKLPLSEKECPSPLSPYAVSKFANDLYAGCLVSRYPAMRVFGLRLFNIFGPWQDPAGDYAAVIPRWIDLLLSGKRAIIFGDGSATRDFCYVDNVCALMAELAEAGAEKPRGGVYNIGTGQSYRLIELYQEIVAALREYGAIATSPGPEHRPWRDGDIVHSLADISKAQAELGFRPEVQLPEGIRRILREQYRLTAR